MKGCVNLHRMGRDGGDRQARILDADKNELAKRIQILSGATGFANARSRRIPCTPGGSVALVGVLGRGHGLILRYRLGWRDPLKQW